MSSTWPGKQVLGLGLINGRLVLSRITYSLLVEKDGYKAI